MITLAEYKVYSNITKSDDDTRLQLIIDSVISFVRQYCYREFTLSARVEYPNIDGNCISAIFPKEYPIVSVESLQERLPNATEYTDVPDYNVNNIIDCIYKVTNGRRGYFPAGIASVKLEYTAGYAELPNDLKMGIFDLITYYNKKEFYKEKSIGQYTVSYSDKDLPEHIKRVLTNYKNVC